MVALLLNNHLGIGYARGPTLGVGTLGRHKGPPYDFGGGFYIGPGDRVLLQKLLQVRDMVFSVVMSGPAEAAGCRSPWASPEATASLRRPGHPSFQEVCSIAQQSGVKKLVLTHIAPGEVDETTTIRSVRENYAGEVVVAHDLLEVIPGKP